MESERAREKERKRGKTKIVIIQCSKQAQLICVDTYAYRRNHQLKLCDRVDGMVNDLKRNVLFVVEPTMPHYGNKQ